jgi:stage II sporulation protein D
VVFSGVGYGHGVGLCQWGAKQRSEDGFDYREILSYYYPGAKLEKIDSDR